MRLVFPVQNVGEIYFLSPVNKSDRHVAFRKIRHLLNSASSYSLLIKVPLYVSLCGIGFQVFLFFFNCHFFSQRTLHVLVIHKLGVNLVRGGKLMENRDPDQPMS